jgi:hypothetical protein
VTFRGPMNSTVTIGGPMIFHLFRDYRESEDFDRDYRGPMTSTVTIGGPMTSTVTIDGPMTSTVTIGGPMTSIVTIVGPMIYHLFRDYSGSDDPTSLP